MYAITIMPFPFLNPWNWSAMTPGRMLESGIVLARLNMDLWRSAVDALSAGVRRQQDALLDAAAAELARTRDNPKAEPKEPPATAIAPPAWPAPPPLAPRASAIGANSAAKPAANARPETEARA
jgi:hypothetical protein